MAQVNIRIDDQLKIAGEQLFNSLGLNFSAAVNAFVAQAVREGGIPFLLTTKGDLFYGSNNMQILRSSINQAEKGMFVTKTIDELEQLSE